MITIISGTNRSGSKTRVIADIVMKYYEEKGVEHELIDLAELPADLFLNNKIYGATPESFVPYQEKILKTDGILNLVPEYNGSFPGIMKYFFDLLKFPESLVGKPAGFIGVAAGHFGGLRAVEQLEMVFQYREAHIYGGRSFIHSVYNVLDDKNLKITDEYLEGKLFKTLEGFNQFCLSLADK